MFREEDDDAYKKALTCLHEKFIHYVHITASKNTNLDEHQALTAYNKAVMELASYVKRTGFSLEKDLKSLLIKIYRNRCIDEIRRSTTTIGGDLDRPVAPPDGANDLLIYCLRLAFKLAGLPEHCWEMFLQRLIDGLSPEELAELYNYKNGNVFASAFYTFKERWKSAMRKICEQHAECRMMCPKPELQ